ncbi:MAG: hypothetical protein Q8P48_01300 [Deltaproteobacteria bacterium]|nr:hypothetical protein [Deltaproteobacteria bacterium]
MNFTDIQQEFIDDLIKKTYARAYSKAEDKYKGELDRLKAEVEELKTKKPFSFWGR